MADRCGAQCYVQQRPLQSWRQNDVVAELTQHARTVRATIAPKQAADKVMGCEA